MKNIVDESRLIQLKELLKITAAEIDLKPGARDLAGLVKQYREILKEIEDIEGVKDEDEIGDILGQRQTDGKSGAVRKNRSRV